MTNMTYNMTYEEARQIGGPPLWEWQEKITADMAEDMLRLEKCSNQEFVAAVRAARREPRGAYTAWMEFVERELSLRRLLQEDFKNV